MHKPEPVLENETQKILWDFEIQTDHLMLVRRPDLVIINKKKRTCCIVDFAVPVDHRVKIKESKKGTNTKTLPENWESCWTWGWRWYQLRLALLEWSQSLEKGLEELEIRVWIETIQTTALLRLAIILRRVLETWGDFLSLRLQWNTTR